MIDGLLATGRRWEDIALEVRDQQYKARGYAPPKPDVVRQYFSLEMAPALDPGYRSPLGYPAALALQYPEVRPMVIAPLLDLLFGLDVSKLDQLKRKQRFSDEVIREAKDQGKLKDAEFMQLLNQIAPGRRRGRASDQPFRPHWSLYQTLLIGRKDLVKLLFAEGRDGFTRNIRPIELETSELMGQVHIDALALLYGLVLESLEFADKGRLRTAKSATLAWLPNLYKLPECRRVAPLLEHAVRSACDQAVARRFSRITAVDRVRPGSWREPGPLTNVAELVYRFPDNADCLSFQTMRELNIERMSKLIEHRVARRPVSRPSDGRVTKVGYADQTTTWLSLREKVKTLKALHEALSLAIPELEGWGDGRFWVMQRETRCAIAAKGQDSFPLMLVDFGHLRGNAVTDRQILAVPWILAEWVWVESTSDLASVSKRLVKFLRRG